MSTILDQIVAHKRLEVAECKSKLPVATLERSTFFQRKPISFRQQIQRPDLNGIIAEFKRKSPSKGILNSQSEVETTTKGYVDAGASALSVLTDSAFFGGSSEDLSVARGANACPILRKDFVIEEYQILEAKALGADAILLIAAILSKEEVARLAQLAHSLQLEVLLEVHNLAELERTLTPHADLVGVNNRNLHDFSVSLEISKELAPHIPAEFVKISESGLQDPASILELRQYGYEGFLMGETFMKQPRPELACAAFIQTLDKARAR